MQALFGTKTPVWKRAHLIADEVTLFGSEEGEGAPIEPGDGMAGREWLLGAIALVQSAGTGLLRRLFLSGEQFKEMGLYVVRSPSTAVPQPSQILK